MPDQTLAPPPTTRRDQIAAVIRLGATLRHQGQRPAALRLALKEHLATFPEPLVDPATLHSVADLLGSLPASQALSAADEILPSLPPPRPASPPVHTAASIAADVPAAVDWLAEPWAAAGAITAITGRPKIGKTTFVLDLLSAVLAGTPFLGCSTRTAPALYLTEQQPASFRASLARSHLLGCDALAVLFWHEAARLPWPATVAYATAECHARGARLLVVDTLSQWAGLRGDMENQAGDALEAVQPLQHLAAGGVAVVFLQHERKSGGDAADAGRGSSAFAGAVDTIVSFRRAPSANLMAGDAPSATSRDDVRLLLGLSRFDAVPRELYIQRRNDEYAILSHSRDFAAQHARPAVLAALPADEAAALSLDDLHAVTHVGRPALIRALRDLLDQQQILRAGSGRKGHPYRYWRATAIPLT